MKNKKINLSLFIMIGVSFLTQVLSLCKSSLVAGSFGTGDAMDAFNLANSIVTFVFGFVASGISTVVIPEYANKRNKKAVDTFITLVYSVMIIVVAVIILLRVQIVSVLSNRGDVFSNLTAYILVPLLLAQYLTSFANITVAHFHSEGMYSTPRIISAICHVCVIITLLLANNLDILQYTFIIVASLVFNFLLDVIIAIKSGWHYKPTVALNEDSKLLFKRIVPIIVSTGVYQLSLMVDTTISSFLDVGKLSILSYSSQISTMVHAVLVGNLTTYIYPKITKRIAETGYQKEFWKNTAVFHAIVCLVSSGFLTVGLEGISLLFQHGTFTAEASKMVFIGAAIYVIGQQPGIIRDLIYRYFYACGNTKVPGINSIIVSVLNIVISILLVWLIGFYGIIIGTVVASTISLGIVLIHFKKNFGLDESFITIIGRYMVSTIIFIATVLVVYLTKYYIPISNDLVSIFVFGTETVVIYAVFYLLLNRKTISNFKNW